MLTVEGRVEQSSLGRISSVIIIMTISRDRKQKRDLPTAKSFDPPGSGLLFPIEFIIISTFVSLNLLFEYSARVCLCETR